MVAAGAEAGVVRQGVVDPPDARGDPVGEDDVDGVVAAREEQRQHARHRRAERQPVQQEPPPGRICEEREDIVHQNHINKLLKYFKSY